MTSNSDKKYLISEAQHGVVQHWATPPVSNWSSLDRPVDLFMHWLHLAKSWDRERNLEIFIERFGIKSGERKTLQQVGEDFNISRERVRQILQRFLRSSRHPSRQRCLAPFASHFDSLFRQYGCIMTTREILYTSKLFDDFGEFSPLNAIELILDNCRSVSAFDYNVEKEKDDVLEIGWITWYLNNEIEPEDIRKARKVALDVLAEAPYKYSLDELINLVSTISGVSSEKTRASLRTLRELKQDSLGIMKKGVRNSELTTSQMAVIALREIMVPAHYTVIFKKMQELFPGRNLTARNVHVRLDALQFRWVDRGTYGLAEWGLPDIKPKKNYETHKKLVVTALRSIGRPAYVNEINKKLENLQNLDFKPLSTTPIILQSNPNIFISFGSGKWGLTEWDIHPSA